LLEKDNAKLQVAAVFLSKLASFLAKKTTHIGIGSIYIAIFKKFTLRRGNSKPIESKPKHDSIFKSGNCPICSNFYNGLKKHYSSCLKKFDKLKSDLTLYGPEQVFPLSQKR
jgi:hypothetical protein